MADKKQQDIKESEAPVTDKSTPEPTVEWDDSNMRTSYANVVNATSTQEEVTLFFGTNLTWKTTEKRAFKVRLDDRIVLNPRAAKRLWILLGIILGEYEKRFGSLGLDIAKAGASAQVQGKE